MEDKVEESVILYGKSHLGGHQKGIREIAKLFGEQDDENPVPMLKIQIVDEKLIKDDKFMALLDRENPMLKIETEGTQLLIFSFMSNQERNQRGLSRLFGKLFIWNETKNNNLGELHESQRSTSQNGLLHQTRRKVGMVNRSSKKQTYIYRPDREIQIKDFSETLTGEDVLVGFEINIASLFEN